MEIISITPLLSETIRKFYKLIYSCFGRFNSIQLNTKLTRLPMAARNLDVKLEIKTKKIMIKYN
jgi:hypothetical protein